MSATCAETVVTVHTPHGLHLRVGKDVVRTASRFSCTITLNNLSRPSPSVDAKSILQLLQLQARESDEIAISAEGEDAVEAIAAMQACFAPEADNEE